MNKLLPLLFIIVAALGCKTEPDRKLVLLDSLKREYAGKEITLTFRNNDAHTEPLTSQYAYTSKDKGDLAFELTTYYKYKVAAEEADIFIPTQQTPEPIKPHMILIEQIGSNKRGFVSYKYISEFKDVTFYDTDK